MNEPVPVREVIHELNREVGFAKVLTIHFDGSCEPKNPGGVATCGWTIHDENDSLIASDAKEVCRGPKATNNLAEWSALGLALRWLLDHRSAVPFDALGIRGDSQLVVNQLNQSWACNKEHLQKLRARCWELLNELKLA